VGVARALAADPPIMLMDEPFGAVDPIVRDRLQNEFLRLQEDLAKTILFVTHDIDEAIKMGDMVVVMQTGGHVAQVGTPAEILASPASDFVARFVGADRGLKRLSLYRVADFPLEPAVTVHVGDAAAAARATAIGAGAPEVLVMDPNGLPLGWLMTEDIPGEGSVTAEMADPSSPIMDRRTTLKDALSMLLDHDVQSGIVVDRHGQLRGLVTIRTVMDWMRDERARAAGDPAPPAQPALEPDEA
jgi:osmoprotectant transport system ATP-binding protein